MDKNSKSNTDEYTAPLNVGLLAHVDAGKTTLAEAILYSAGKLKSPGRVDHKDSFLDTHELERKRGITIFSKQAAFDFHGRRINLIDTPGHVDFFPETERTLSVLDCAVLIISSKDKVSSHTKTLWRLLKAHKIPVIIFVNKMDLDGGDRHEILSELTSRLDTGCIDFTKKDSSFYEECATCSEEALEEYLAKGFISDDLLSHIILSRGLFPCLFGSAVNFEGTDLLLELIDTYIKSPSYPSDFGAKIYKISRDKKNERLTHLKITGGCLKVKSAVSYKAQIRDMQDLSSENITEKIHQIRIYDSDSYELADEALPGQICAVCGLSRTYAGSTLGFEKNETAAILVPLLTYRLILPAGCDINRAVRSLKQLEEEEPSLNLQFNESTCEISIQVMGEVELEILKALICERLGLCVSFGEGSIIYKETIQSTAEGVGHFEPLSHYSEVHLILSPGEKGSGLVFENRCSEDMLDKNWQRLILSYLSEKRHKGVLTGSELTDVKITLASGRASTKHTEGGDFRQAACRAIRQGLMQAKSVLLEPYYSFTLEVPSEMTGRAMNDITKMSGSFSAPETFDETSILTGFAPVSTIRNYQTELVSYTHGKGNLFLEFSGYEPCHNADEVIESIGYCAEDDSDNPSCSVFFSHGSGYIVPWNEVFNHMHLAPVLENKKPDTSGLKTDKTQSAAAGYNELKEIFERTYGKGSFDKNNSEFIFEEQIRKSKASPENSGKNFSVKEQKEKYLFVDGYNIIFADEYMKSLAMENIQAAREELMDMLCSFQAYKGIKLILVFDGYKVRGNPGESFKYNGLDIVYTKEGESADQYIEQAAAKAAKKYDVTVATSDALEQISIFSHGANRMSAAQLYAQIEEMSDEIRRKYLKDP